MQQVATLRAEVLRAAVIYGVCASLAEGGTHADEWLAWLEWVADLRSTLTGQTRSDHEPLAFPEWLQDLIDALEAGAYDEPRNLFAEPDFRDWSRDEFEVLAERARPIERLGLEPLGEIGDQPPAAGPRLLALLQDSLVLASAEDRQAWEQRVKAIELLEHLNAARAAGTWELLTR